MLLTVVRGVGSLVSTSVAVVMVTSSTEPNSGVTGKTIVVLVTNYTNPCFGAIKIPVIGVEPFNAAIGLQGGLTSNQLLPRVSAQRYAAVLPVSDQRVQGVSCLVDDDNICLLFAMDFHTEADLGEGCVPVSW